MAQWGFEGGCLQGAWGAVLPCRDRAHPMETPRGPGTHSLPCPLCHGPYGEGGIMTQGLVPSQAHCSHAQSSLCSSDISKPSCDTARWSMAQDGVGKGDPETKAG